MKAADAHCDTLLNFVENPFHSEEACWNIDKFRSAGGTLQYMAVCMEPPFHGDSALRFAATAYGSFWRHKPADVVHLAKAEDYDEDKLNIVLALEGASPIIDDMNNLYAFYQMGMRAMTLTWNHRNFLGDGVFNDYGLTGFGREVVKEMEKLRIIVDVSHLNTAGFDDVCEISEKPFAATHSNSREIYEHPRNLYDEQIKEIFRREGFIGINVYSVFLDESRDRKILLDKFLRNVEHMLELGGEDRLGLGADFDGMDESPFEDARCYGEIREMLAKDLHLNESVIDKILYTNLRDFTLKMI